MANMRTVKPKETYIYAEVLAPPAPVDGARAVYWNVHGEWVHKGWLMPEVRAAS